MTWQTQRTTLHITKTQNDTCKYARCNKAERKKRQERQSKLYGRGKIDKKRKCKAQSVFSNFINFALQRRIKVRTKPNIFRNIAILKQILLHYFATFALYSNSMHVAISIRRNKWMLRILLRKTFLN